MALVMLAPPQLLIHKINQYSPVEKKKKPNRRDVANFLSLWSNMKKKAGKIRQGKKNKSKGKNEKTNSEPSKHAHI